MPRLGLAARADAAPPRARRALRLGLPDPAQARREAARRARRHRRTTSPTSTRGPRSTCRARAGSASTRPRDCSPARGTSRSPAHARAAQRRAGHRSRGPSRGASCEHEMSVTRIHEDPRVTKPYTDAQWETILAARRARRRRAGAPATCGSPWAASRRSCPIDDRDGAEWNTAALGPAQAAPGRERSSGGCAALRAGGFCTSARASGIPASRCRAGPSPVTGARTARPVWGDPALVADERSTTATVRRRRSGSPDAGPPSCGVDRRVRPARLRRRLLLPVARAPASGNVDPSTHRSTTSSSASACARVFEQGLDTVVGYVAAHRRRGQTAGAGRPRRGCCGARTCS